MINSTRYHSFFISTIRSAKCIALLCTFFFVHLERVFQRPHFIVVVFIVSFVFNILSCEVWSRSKTNIWLAIERCIWATNVTRKFRSTTMRNKIFAFRTHSVLWGVLNWYLSFNLGHIFLSEKLFLFVQDWNDISLEKRIIAWYLILCRRWSCVLHSDYVLSFWINNIWKSRLSYTEGRVVFGMTQLDILPN